MTLGTLFDSLRALRNRVAGAKAAAEDMPRR